MSEHNCVNVNGCTPSVSVRTLPAGPRGIGIAKMTQQENTVTVHYDNGTSQTLLMPDWWFGTRDEYNSLSDSEKTERSLYFIEEGT